MAHSDTPSNGVNGHHGVNGSNGVHKNGLNGSHSIDYLNETCKDIPPQSANSPEINGSHQESSSQSHEKSAMPIAICGMGFRLPGGLATPEQLWDFLLSKGDARCRVPESRYNVSAYYSPSGRIGSVNTEYGYFLHDDLTVLDTSCFTMARSEVEHADPQQRLLLEVARECFDDAGVTGWRGKKIGCYIGNFGEDWATMSSKEPQQRGQYRIMGNGDYIISNRLSYEMDLQGPCMTIRTACSSALTALNEACMALSRGDCEAALVGGVNLILAPDMTIAMTEQGVLSPTGSCKSFSADADGYARAEAVTAIYVKPLADAIRDGNPVRAVIRGTSHNFDGKTNGMSQPSSEAQEALIRRAYETAGINDFGATAMVECHGTGTVKGDPIEAKAVARVFGEQGLYIGSIKPNLGHTEAASGLVSLIKMVLALEHRIIPPNIGFTTPNPNIPFESAKLKVPLEPTPWPESKAERVSISSFGIGGVNAHAILDSAASFGVAQSSRARPPSQAQLLLYSANSSRSVARMPSDFAEWASKNADQLDDLAYTLATRREHLPHRCFAIAEKNGTIGAASPATKPLAAGQRPPNVIMVFTGQGAQWPQMGRELIQFNTVFRDSIQNLDKHLKDVDGDDAADYSIEEELLKPARQSRVGKAALSQPLCTAIQIALFDTLRSLGIEPAAVTGHSSGEIAAAYATGALTAREAILASHLRGKIVSSQERAGSMAAIGLSWADTERFLVPGAVLACDNSPNSVTVSGNTEAVEEVLKRVRATEPGALARLLQVDKAYHSHHMSEIGDRYLEALTRQKVFGNNRRTIPFFSSVNSALLPEKAELGAQYWRANLESPVRFREAVVNILNHDLGKQALFLEIGPHSALAGPLRQIFTSVASTASYVSALVRSRDCLESLLAAVGKIWSLHIPVRLETLLTGDKCLPDLPRYPWDHEGGNFWHESRVSEEWRHRKHTHHELLGIRLPESSAIEPSWRNVFHLQDVPWVRDHKFGGDAVFPFTAYIATAGEAVKQITGVTEGYSIRNMVISAALVLPEGKPSEIITTFKPSRLTRSLNSQWWVFTVVSHNGQSWTKHCTGEIKAISSTSVGSLNENIDPLPRKLSPREWYETIRKTGLSLGPSFQTFRSLEASVDSSHQARANVGAITEETESDYHLHPISIDSALQLLGCAAVNGRARMIKSWLPSSMEQLTVTRCGDTSSPLIASATARISSNLSLVGSTRCIIGESLVLEASGIRMGLADSQASQDNSAAARYTWAPDAAFARIDELIKPASGRGPQTKLLDEMAKKCLQSSDPLTTQTQPASEHLKRYSTWLGSQSSNDASTTTIHDQITEATASGYNSALAALHQVSSNLDAILAGETTLEKLLSHDAMHEVASFMAHQVNQTPFLQCLAHTKPTLRVLEIGDERFPSIAGTTIKDLTLPGGQVIRYSKYTITSKGYVSEKDQERESDNVEYISLDIGQDLLEQNFAERQYDLIIASGITQAEDPSVSKRKMANMKTLLAPGGRLLLQEFNPSSTWANFVFGSQYTWWGGAHTCSISSSSKNEEALDNLSQKLRSELSDAGLTDVEALFEDSLSVTVVVRPSSNCVGTSLEKKVTLLCLDNKSTEGELTVDEIVAQKLREDGYEVTRCSLADDVPLEHDILCLLDASGPFFETIDSVSYETLRGLITRLSNNRGSGILWATLSCQMGCQNPSYAPVIGFSRTLRSEMLLDFATCEVESFKGDADLLMDVFNAFRNRRGRLQPADGSSRDGKGDSLGPDFEYIVRDGKVHVGRFYPFSLQDELVKSDVADRAVVDVATPGRVNSLQWEEQPREILGSKEVEIEVHAAGLNFRDILVALNIVELPSRQFGVEAAGKVSKVGADVKDLRVGDRVLCIRKHTFATHFVVPDFMCAKIPDSLSFDEAGSMIFAFATAIYSLVNVGGMEKGQSVLIHSACGGVGLAAVQAAQMYGADIYATVSSKEKVQFLMENFGIPRHRILQSRDDSFVEGVLRETNGQGVDLVLNSLSGELLHATWSCVAPFGKMIEIGKRDLLGHGKLDMRPFLENRTYSCVDMDQLWQRPEIFKRVIHSIVENYEKGLLSPIRPVKVFPADRIQEAFRYMQHGQHIGRVCLSIRDPSGNTRLGAGVIPRKRDVKFDTNGSYLLIGGLGGLGRAVLRWMVEHGAGELIILSRRAGTDPDDNAFVDELVSAGCRGVRLVSGDVTKSEDVAKAVASATLKLKGVIQMSMVARDGSFENMSFEDWNAATTPKIQGTWNLHNATIGFDLDFFILFSSLSGAIGQRHQANYASANTFLDAFVQYRSSLGLPASAIGLGAVEEIGYISRNPQLLIRMKANEWKCLTEQQVLDAVALAMETQNRPSASPNFAELNTFVLGLASTTPLNSPNNRTIWKDDRRMAVYHNMAVAAGAGATAGGGSDEAIKAFLSNSRADPSILKTDEAAKLLAVEIGKKLFALLLKSEQEEPSLSWPLVDLGLDSLIAIELRAWWRETLGFDISTLEMLSTATLLALGQRAASGLLELSGAV